MQRVFDYKKARAGERYKGTVVQFHKLKGFGFIQTETGDKIFVHFSDIEGQSYRTLTEGEEVEFAIVHGSKGLQAVEVKRLNPPDEDVADEPTLNKRKW
ncbi:cold shock domain-containing protein [Calditrichota bacterium]